MPDTLINELYDYRLFLSFFLTGLLLILAGIYVSVYKIAPFNYKKIKNMRKETYLCLLEIFTNRFPLKILSCKLLNSISYFLLEDLTARRIVAAFTLGLPAAGSIMYLVLDGILDLWYTKLVTLIMCIMVPYYVFTLIVDYMKYNLRMKIPDLIDCFRSSFMLHYRIKPALLECSRNVDRTFGRIISRASDCSDLNDSLCGVRDRIDDTWFNIFILLLVNYRENGGELIAQLYKLNRTITRYNNIEKKKNKRLIWYEVFTVGASILSLPVILLLNRTILGTNTGLYYNVTASFAKIAAFSLGALLMVRILRRV